MIGRKPLNFPDVNHVFNVNDFTYEDDIALTLGEARQIFIVKSGDIVSGQFLFNNTEIFYGDVTINNHNLSVYDANNYEVITLDYSGNINCKAINCTAFTNGTISNTQLN